MQQPTYVFIATGIGITPFRSMIKYLVDTHTKKSILLLYRTSAQEILYNDIFTQAEKLGIQTIYLTDKQKINAALLKEYMPEIQTPLYYLSGPQLAVEAQRAVLMELGIENDHIKTDLFSGYE